MAAAPVSIPTPSVSNRRRRVALTERRLAANRRNAARSTGPRSPVGKAKVARNAIKHGFFVAPERWTPTQRRNFAELYEGLRDEFRPQSIVEESRVASIAESYVKMAAMLRYENIAALKFHQQQDRALNERIAAADATEAARLHAYREDLRRADLWRPTLPGPRETIAIIRYNGSLERSIRRATAELENLKIVRNGHVDGHRNAQKQTHSQTLPNAQPSRIDLRRERSATDQIAQKQSHFERHPSSAENAKTNPLSSMFMGNRHQRRRAKALAARRGRL